jgi:hypothetical protein
MEALVLTIVHTTLCPGSSDSSTLVRADKRFFYPILYPPRCRVGSSQTYLVGSCWQIFDCWACACDCVFEPWFLATTRLQPIVNPRSRVQKNPNILGDRLKTFAIEALGLNNL